MLTADEMHEVLHYASKTDLNARTLAKLSDMTDLLHKRRAPSTFEEALWLLAMERNYLMARKNRQYGKSNITQFGLLGVIVRANDKLQRLVTLVVQPALKGEKPTKPADESVEDTLMDLANYATIGQMLHRDWWMLPYEEAVASTKPLPPCSKCGTAYLGTAEQHKGTCAGEA